MPPIVLVTLAPSSIIGWIIVGLIAGWLAGNVMSGRGYGFVGDLVIGLVGAFIGGIIVSLFTSQTYSLIGSIVVAFIGACVLVALLRSVRGQGKRISIGGMARLSRIGQSHRGVTAHHDHLPIRTPA
jgi:uncharacterized membrane protein YeaQ/YmgE (transglycosylase-associated protein family)